jgi:hypothetical protein
VIGHLFDDEACYEADIRTTAVDPSLRCGRTVDRLGVSTLDEAAHVLEYHIATRALCQMVAGLLADYLELIRGKSFDLGIRDRNGLNRYSRFVEEWNAIGFADSLL